MDVIVSLDSRNCLSFGMGRSLLYGLWILRLLCSFTSLFDNGHSHHVARLPAPCSEASPHTTGPGYVAFRWVGGPGKAVSLKFLPFCFSVWAGWRPYSFSIYSPPIADLAIECLKANSGSHSQGPPVADRETAASLRFE